MNSIYKYEPCKDPQIDPAILSIINQHLSKHSATVFEAYDTYVIMSFTWYNLKSKAKTLKKISIFLNGQDLLLFIEDTHQLQHYQRLFSENCKKDHLELLRIFFNELLGNDMEYIDAYETSITNVEDHALQDSRKDYLNKIIKFRKQLLHLKHYYNQLQVIFDGLLENENKYFDDETLRKLTILHDRIDHLQLSVSNLRDYVTQMREAYQSQIDIEQNHIMKIFTLITAIFLPLTLMVGWYGMNFRYMHELDSPYGYPVFIIVSVLVCVLLVFYFKKKRWF